MTGQVVKTEQQRYKLPVIGIVPSQNSSEKMVSFPERYAQAIIRAHGAPLLLPLSGDSRIYETLFPLIDGFVLTGGNDIDPARYGAIRDSGKISEHSPEREELEYLILSYAYRFDLPLLGICRGMQMINVCFGGTLYRDLTDQFSGIEREEYLSDCEGLSSIIHWQELPYDRPTHRVDISPDSRLGRLLNVDQIKVNSMHHQGICDLSSLVDPVAYAPDGLVEAIEVRNRGFMMGVQWHPEFFSSSEHRMARVFEALVEAAEFHKNQKFKRDSVAISQSKNSDTVSHWPSILFADCI